MTSTPPRPAPSGTEIMLRSLGLDGVINAARELANAGSVARIVSFANQTEALAGGIGTLGARLDRMEALLGYLARRSLDLDRDELAAILAAELLAAQAGARSEPGAGSPPGEPGAAGAQPDPGQQRAAG